MNDQATVAVKNGRDSDLFDVAILGCGFEGSLLGIILARHGYKVLIVDASQHPKFALGESTVRHTWRTLKIIGERYDIPEIRKCFSSGEAVHKYVTSSCGIKRNFGFVYHREGEHQRPEEATQLVIPPLGEGYEAHLFRQDIDAFLSNTAAHYGARLCFNTPIEHVDVRADVVTIRSNKGAVFHARYVVDATGPFSLLSRIWGLRDNPPRLRVNTRCVFSHMVDVTPYDDLTLPNGVPRMPERWYSGTCHHLFDGGWLWVIPFDNRKGSTNAACSIGLSLDNARFPKPADQTPEQEWFAFLERFPSIKEQFKKAKAIREWVSTGRMQNTVTQAVGDRWIMTSGAHGSGFLDAMFSRGLANSTEMLNALAARLMKALNDDDLRAERFEYCERLMNAHVARNDELTYATYLSFRSFDLWNAWYRLWAIGVGLGDYRLGLIYQTYLKTRDESVLPDAQEPPLGLFSSNHPGYGELFAKSFAEMLKVERGEQTIQETCNRIFQLVREAPFHSPALGLGDPSSKVIHLSRPSVAVRSFIWSLTQAPPDVREMGLAAFKAFLPIGAR